MDIYRRTNGWFDDNDPCLILSWRRTIVIWSTFEPITVPLLARKSITKHVLLRAKNDAWIFIGGPTGDSTITIPVGFCREEEQSSFDHFRPITVLLLARKSITKHVLLRAKNDAWIFIGGPTGDSTMTIPVWFCREEEQSLFDQLSNQSRFFCLLESPSRNMFFFAQKWRMDIYRRTNGWFDDNDPCLILSWRRTIVIWSTFEPITVPLLARKSITKHVLLRAKDDAWIFIGGPTGDSTITIPVRFCREEEQSLFDQLSNQSRFFCLLESPSRNMFFFAQKSDAWIFIGGPTGDSTITIPVGFRREEEQSSFDHFRSNHGSSAC